MVQAEGSDKSTNALQHKDEDKPAHNVAPRNWLTRNWKTLGGVGGLLAAGGAGVSALIWASSAIDDIGLALNFIAQNTLGLFVLLAVIVQLIISNKQWDAMTEGLKIERAKTDPRLRVAEVTAESFKPGNRPIYVVTIANDGLLAATDVRIHMSIEINNEKPMDWINDVVVTIPAGGRDHHFIHSSTWLSEEQLESFENGKDSLRVVGFFEYAPIGHTPFCYKYLPLQGEFRPPKIPQFVDCNYTPRLNTTLTIQPGHHALTGSAVILTHGKVIPKAEDEGEKEQGEDGDKDSGENPN